MDIKLINHASVLIKLDNVTILTDPWYTGKAFNNSWSLLTNNEPSNDDYLNLDYIWISHEHPDHFHIPTLKRISASVSDNCTIILQKKNSKKIENVLRNFGFNRFIKMRHDTFRAITSEIEIYSYQVGLMDSIMGIRRDGDVLININDCSIHNSEIKHIKNRLGGKSPILLNQFSLAGNNGSEKNVKQLEDKADNIIDDMLRTHLAFNAKATIPFASFMYFSSSTNCYMNEYANKVTDVLRAFEYANCVMRVLYYNESYSDTSVSSIKSSLLWDQLYERKIKEGDFSIYETVTTDLLREALSAKRDLLINRYPRFLVRKLSSVFFLIEDHNTIYELNLFEDKFEEVKSSTYDIKIHSQPLEHALKMPWGVQTIGVGAQYFIESNWKTWSWYRLLFNLNNMEIFLRFRFLIKLELWEYLMDRVRLTSLVSAVVKLKQTFISPITEE